MKIRLGKTGSLGSWSRVMVCCSKLSFKEGLLKQNMTLLQSPTDPFLPTLMEIWFIRNLNDRKEENKSKMINSMSGSNYLCLLKLKITEWKELCGQLWNHHANHNVWKKKLRTHWPVWFFNLVILWVCCK